MQDGQNEGVEGVRDRGTPVSAALVPLREVVGSLQRARTGWFPKGAERQRLSRRARRAGIAVLPSLLRGLGSESDHEAAWAHCLLRAVAATAAEAAPVRARALQQLNAILVDPRPRDQVKARVLALLSDLGAPLGDEVVLRDPDGLLAQSVRELLSGLQSASEIGEAVELIFAQVPEAELRSFLDEVARHGGAVARPLFSALIADPRMPIAVARHYLGQYRPTPTPPRTAPVRRTLRQKRLPKALRQLYKDMHRPQRGLDSLATAIEHAYPGTPIDRVLAGEELFQRAYAALRAADYDDAISGFQRVLELLPSHHASWGNLGVAYQAQLQTHRAVHCWRQALLLNPHYVLARQNLSLLGQS